MMRDLRSEEIEASLGPNFAKKTNKQEHKILLKFPIQENLQSRPVYKSKISFSKELECEMVKVFLENSKEIEFSKKNKEKIGSKHSSR